MVILNVEGMTCASCENKVKTALMNCESVKGCEVNWKNGRAMVKIAKGSANTAEMIKAVEETGFSAESKEAIQYGAEPELKSEEKEYHNFINFVTNPCITIFARSDLNQRLLAWKASDQNLSVLAKEVGRAFKIWCFID